MTCNPGVKLQIPKDRCTRNVFVLIVTKGTHVAANIASNTLKKIKMNVLGKNTL